MTHDPETQDRSSTSSSMTCRQLGGPCDLTHHGNDANEIIQEHDRHLNAVVAAGDTDHAAALKAMKGRWRRPVSGLKWYRQVQRDFAALADGPLDQRQGDVGSAT